MKLSESIEILRRKQAKAQLQLDGGCFGGQYEGIVKAIDEVCDCINLLVVNEFIPFVTETREYLPEAIDILETEKQDTIFDILTTEDDQKFIEKIPAMQEFVLAVDIVLYLMKRYLPTFVGITNGDRIRDFGDHELAEFLASIQEPEDDELLIEGKQFFSENEILSWLKESCK